jgi:threonine dehydratase
VIGLKEIRAAVPAIARVAIRTPVLPLKELGIPDVFVKCENLQRGGAFKIRGAFNNIRSKLRAARRHGVIGCSSGNHAQGMALAARALGVDATVVMLDQSVPHKVEATRRYGARVIFGGKTSTAIFARAEAIARRRGCVMIHPFNDPETIAGAGSIGLELLSQLPHVKAVVVPIGGGGLISGVATAIKETNPRVKVYGAEPAGAPKMFRSRRAGRLVTLDGTDTIADGLKPVRGGPNTFAQIEKYVDEIVLVTDRQILRACRHLILREKLVVEPSGAATVAAIQSGKIRPPRDGPICAVLSGGNVDLDAVLGRR